MLWDYSTDVTKAKDDDKTLFEKQLEFYRIEYQKTRPYTPRHNGKVEHSHRRDNEFFMP